MLFKISNSFFYTQKVTYFLFKDSSSPVKASSFNPLSPDLLTLYCRPNLIKIWPTYALPPTTTLYPRSTNDLWRAGSSPTIFNRLKNLSRSPRPLRAGPTNPRCILDQHTLSPIKPAHCRSVHFSRAGESWGWSGLWCEQAFRILHKKWNKFLKKYIPANCALPDHINLNVWSFLKLKPQVK